MHAVQDTLPASATETLRFPHEDLADLRERSPIDDYILGVERLVERSRGTALNFGYRNDNEVSISKALQEIFRLNNGPAGTELQIKNSFGTVINDLGYTAPRHVVFTPSEAAKNPEIEDSIDALDPESSRRFWKPLFTYGGNGAFEAESLAEALWKIEKPTQTYLAQTVHTPAEDWRYVLHRDAAAVSDGDPPGWRIAYAKVRPEVIGDGTTSIDELVQAHSMPNPSKLRIRRNQDVSRVPEPGEVVKLVNTGNIEQGAYGRMPTADEVTVLDNFMLGVWNDLEANYDTRFGTLCFDIGVMSPGLLRATASAAELRKGIVFYEHQMPFGVSGYLDQISDGDDRQPANDIHDIFYRRAMRASGYMLNLAA